MVLGIGVDMVELVEFEALLDDVFEAYVFSDAERAWARQTASPVTSLAQIFACKEALAKAVDGLSVPAGSDLRLFEIGRDGNGEPVAIFSGRSAEVLACAGVRKACLSVSGADSAVVATALVEG